MAVSVDTVYQRVLALANKEQRGYITPQEFNLFANQAQMDIFEQYFFDINQFNRPPGNSTEYSDMTTMLNEKISLFKTSKNLTYDSATDINHFPMPSDLYRLGTVHWGGVGLENKIEVTEINYNELPYLISSPLIEPTVERPVFAKRQEGIVVLPSTIISGVTLTYIKIPHKVEWGYVVLNDKALYNSNTSVDFSLHPSEETELVYKILTLCGISIGGELYQAGATEDQRNINQEKQ